MIRTTQLTHFDYENDLGILFGSYYHKSKIDHSSHLNILHDFHLETYIIIYKSAFFLYSNLGV
jgi:hypothetical protein